MARQNRAGGWESTLLAIALAVAGTLFFFGRIRDLVAAGAFSVHTLETSAPAFLLVVAVGLILADQGTFHRNGGNGREGRERRSA